MRRSVVISLVDALAFVSFVFLIGTGFLLKYVLPPGSGNVIAEGAGRRALTRPVAVVWGWTRHEWGNVHFWLSVSFLLVMVAHLIIHWRWIVVSLKGRRPRESQLQFALGLAAVLGVILLALAPLFSPRRVYPRRDLIEQRQEEASEKQGLQPHPGQRGGGSRHAF